jgi:hypothetical protein
MSALQIVLVPAVNSLCGRQASLRVWCCVAVAVAGVATLSLAKSECPSASWASRSVVHTPDSDACRLSIPLYILTLP